VISGHVRVGSHSFLGVNATVRNSITIAPESLIAAGAVIMKSTVAKGVYYPERAKRAPKSSDEIEL
jgi:acetyltransferase-like isoleucine patch superfamily enzyme